ncbi:MAG TPA: EAL domain-containing protein [Burkholderiales bacterium]|nr:EAL domain-containing protein [Burkholderiales bacterium]
MKDLLVWIGDDGRLLHGNAAALKFYGHDLGSFTRLTIHDLDVHFRRESWPQHWEALKRNRVLTVTVQHCNAAGVFYPVEVVDNYQCVDGHEFSLAVVRVVEHRDDRAQRLQLMEFSVDQMTDSALWIAKDARIIFANDATCRNLGYTHDELVKMTVFDIDPNMTPETWPRDWERLRKHKTMTFETTHRRKNGHTMPAEIHANLVRVYEQEYNCAFVRDITERKVHEAELTRLATHDVLTGLPNRTLLHDRIDHAILHAKRNKEYSGVMLVDLDKFKFVNDNLGHDAGDELLKELASRMKSILRATDTVARLGGDEFMIVLEGVAHPEDCALVGQKLMQVITKPMVLGGATMEIGASVGIAVYPLDGEDATALMKNADIAMYQVKSGGRGNYQFYEREMGERASRHLSIITGLQEALKNDRFILHYQPIFDLKSRQLVAAEALLRWQDPERGLIPPNEFIPVAEESGLIGAMGAWVIGETCRQNSRWRKDGMKVVPVSVNLSAYQLRGTEIVGVVRKALADHALPSRLISLELTESMVMEDPERVIGLLKEIQGLGVMIAIDDFGTGYSSLSYLQQFPIDVIKIDRSFVKGISGDAKDAVIANAIIKLAHGLGYKVLAEGVETELQSDYLRGQGCDLVQGFLYGRPVPAKEFEQVLHRGLLARGGTSSAGA